jgi:MFS family permease
MVVLQAEYGAENIQKGAIAAAVLIGAVVGQLLFGILADRIGRRKGLS